MAENHNTPLQPLKHGTASPKRVELKGSETEIVLKSYAQLLLMKNDHNVPANVGFNNKLDHAIKHALKTVYESAMTEGVHDVSTAIYDYAKSATRTYAPLPSLSDPKTKEENLKILEDIIFNISKPCIIRNNAMLGQKIKHMLAILQSSERLTNKIPIIKQGLQALQADPYRTLKSDKTEQGHIAFKNVTKLIGAIDSLVKEKNFLASKLLVIPLLRQIETVRHNKGVIQSLNKVADRLIASPSPDNIPTIKPK